MLLFIGPIGTPEIAVIVLLAILLFGADKIPKIARSAGKAQKEFKKAKIEGKEELKKVKKENIKND